MRGLGPCSIGRGIEWQEEDRLRRENNKEFMIGYLRAEGEGNLPLFIQQLTPVHPTIPPPTFFRATSISFSFLPSFLLPSPRSFLSYIQLSISHSSFFPLSLLPYIHPPMYTSSIYLYAHQPIQLFIHPNTYPTIHPFIHSFTHLSIHPFFHSSILHLVF